MKSEPLSLQTVEPDIAPLPEVSGGRSQFQSEIESNLARRMAAFDELIQRTSHALNAEDVVGLICQYILKIIDSERASLIVLSEDPTRGSIISLQTAHELPGFLDKGVYEVLTEYAVWVAIQEKRLVSWQQIQRYNNYTDFKRLSAAGFQTVMHVPLITSGRVVGTLNTARKEEEPYSLIEQSLLSALGSYLAAIFENRKLFQANKHLINALESSKQQLEDKNHALDQSLRKVEEANSQLVEIHSRADRIFSALMLALPGRVLDDKYRLEENIGNGGFGAVFRSVELSSGRHVAVKVFRPKPGNDSAAAVERFRLEGLASSQLNHPNIVRVIESGITSDGIAYLAMELLSGIPLSTALFDRARWTTGYILEVTRQIANGLAKAHEMGVIHRDIKPDNVFLHRGESAAIVKVLDFGVSKLVGETPLHVRNLVSVEGCGPGTPIYMAPERLAGGAYDGKSDVFSLGVMLYQMVGGKLPIPRNSTSLFDPANRVEDPGIAALANLRDNVPEELRRLISRLLKPEAARRPSAAELAADLERLCREYTLGHKHQLDADFRPDASYLDVHSATEDDNQATVLA